MERRNKNVLITEHRYSFLPRLYEEKRSGRFCVQFMTFSNEENSLAVLDKWRKQCINWCYARHEDGKFGDQKYLDVWPATYRNIHILENQGGGVAPWNLGLYYFYRNGNSVTGKVKRTGLLFEIIFYHFQYVKLLRDGSFDVGWYLIPSSFKKLLYIPYILKIQAIEIRLHTVNIKYCTGFTNFKADNIKNFLKVLLKNNFGYNIIRIKK